MSVAGLTNGMLHLIYTGPNGKTIQTLASDNLRDCAPLATNTVPQTSELNVFDTATNPWRCYRAVKP